MSCVENFETLASPIWQACNGTKHIQPMRIHAWRVVEYQSRSTTRELVDSTEEHTLLETMLEEQSKPPLSHTHEFQGLHYLLSTPFRYPPLKYGSRFGDRFERSLWYGSKEIQTAFGEVAFYRFLFFGASAAALTPCTVHLSAYRALVTTEQAILLGDIPFAEYKNKIVQKDSYQHSQPLGMNMRRDQIQAFSYPSARVEGINIGVFTPYAFSERSQIKTCQTWQCYVDPICVEFKRSPLFKMHPWVFQKAHFLLNGELPFAHCSAYA